jgi:hypothetical protein
VIILQNAVYADNFTIPFGTAAQHVLDPSMVLVGGGGTYIYIYIYIYITIISFIITEIYGWFVRVVVPFSHWHIYAHVVRKTCTRSSRCLTAVITCTGGCNHQSQSPTKSLKG